MALRPWTSEGSPIRPICLNLSSVLGSLVLEAGKVGFMIGGKFKGSRSLIPFFYKSPGDYRINWSRDLNFQYQNACKRPLVSQWWLFYVFAQIGIASEMNLSLQMINISLVLVFLDLFNFTNNWRIYTLIFAVDYFFLIRRRRIYKAHTSCKKNS